MQDGAICHLGAPSPRSERPQLPAGDGEVVVAYRVVLYFPQ